MAKTPKASHIFLHDPLMGFVFVDRKAGSVRILRGGPCDVDPATTTATVEAKDVSTSCVVGPEEPESQAGLFDVTVLTRFIHQDHLTWQVYGAQLAARHAGFVSLADETLIDDVGMVGAGQIVSGRCTAATVEAMASDPDVTILTQDEVL